MPARDRRRSTCSPTLLKRKIVLRFYADLRQHSFRMRNTGSHPAPPALDALWRPSWIPTCGEAGQEKRGQGGPVQNRLVAVRPSGQSWEIYGRHVVAICCYVAHQASCGRDLVDVFTIARPDPLYAIRHGRRGLLKRAGLVWRRTRHSLKKSGTNNGSDKPNLKSGRWSSEPSVAKSNSPT